MINSISISKVATYDEEGVSINDLKKVNFIYGANATGKTTITRLLDDENHLDFQECSVEWEHGNPLQTLVYNKDFRDNNFLQGKIPGVFTLGEATQKEKKAIEEMELELKKIRDEATEKSNKLEEAKNEKQKIEDDFVEEAWLIYTNHTPSFKEAFSGVKKKGIFKEKLITEYSTKEGVELKTCDELEALAKTIFGEIPTELSPIMEINYSNLLEIEDDLIWGKKILGKEDIKIAKLIQSLNINDWVNEGRRHLQENNNVCPFCQEGTITESFRQQLEEYFDQAFKEDIGRTKELSSTYSLAADNLKNTLNEIINKENENPDSKLNLELLRGYKSKVVTQLHLNEELIEKKNKEPSRSLSLTKLKEQLDSIFELIVEANGDIVMHNKIVSNYKQEKAGLIKSIWKFLVEKHSVPILNYQRNILEKENHIAALVERKEKLIIKEGQQNEKIIEANKNVTSIQPSVDAINKTLKNHGFLNFKIAPSTDNQYQIQREAESIKASTLSEGEITFLTFLYFLQQAKGGLTEDVISEERVLVIDDPISSLDSNVLFIVSTLIKEILKEVWHDHGVIKQVILLTHNVYFHKEVSRGWYQNAPKEIKNNTSFWILRKKNKISTIQSYKENPIHNSYELLWKELKNRKQNDNITIQNTMRRIIEIYFKFFGDHDDEYLIGSFKDCEKKQICSSLMDWLNDGSHVNPDGSCTDLDNSIDIYIVVFEDIFKNTNHHAHYKMMMGIQDS